MHGIGIVHSGRCWNLSSHLHGTAISSNTTAVGCVLLSWLSPGTDGARHFARRSPPERAVPIIFIIVGAMAVPVVLQMIREALRQTYYGGVMIDMRSQPPSVMSDPRIPGNMVFVIETDGKATRYTSDQLSPELLSTVLKAK